MTQIDISFDGTNDLLIEQINGGEYELKLMIDDHPFTKLTKVQYEDLKTNGLLSNQMLYLIID